MDYSRKVKIFKVVCFLAIFLFFGCSPGKVNKLLFLKRQEKIKQEIIKNQAESYNKLKDHIKEGNIYRGLKKKDILTAFGQPVVSLIIEPSPLEESAFGKEKWVYRDAAEDWFTGEKVYLIFDKSGSLLTWDCINCSF
jgi:hypothetical protein